MEFLGKLHGVEGKDSIVNSAQSDENKQNSMESSETILWKDHPSYSHYFKLVRMGLPVEVVQSKMAQHHLDPTVLELAFPFNHNIEMTLSLLYLLLCYNDSLFIVYFPFVCKMYSKQHRVRSEDRYKPVDIVLCSCKA